MVRFSVKVIKTIPEFIELTSVHFVTVYISLPVRHVIFVT